MIAEHAMVVLNCDRPLVGLYSGDVGCVVHVYGNGVAYEVEFVDGDGSSVACITLDAKDVRNLEQGEMLHTRRRES
jgi:hypothetical protein